ncbi:arginyl-tRNA synthetase [Acaromyces ingoldii]|uniref:arginine--tRNA ligase n=1 Tax=Acaromyces ingoldii TaxID=215250 RepID=A0A316YML4_9BASI|nr:arginyl-tRNA synthetase [Acaromyces ingoldii]PWN90441.1 arginyl-tRNA synthetase [Acaromyces ingoldii]
MAPFNGVALLSQLPELPKIQGVEHTDNPNIAFRLAIAQTLVQALPEISLEAAFEGVQVSNKEGDFSVAIPRFRLKSGKPPELAEKVAKAFQPSPWIESVQAKGAFLHYIVPTSTLSNLVLSTIQAMTPPPPSDSADKKKSVAEQTSAYGTNRSGAGKKAIVEFSSPNIAKPFHAGHLRSTIIGAFLANLYEANGWYVERWNYLGDWGKQFGLLAVAWEKFGNEEKLKEDAVKHLYDIYVQINREADEHPELHDQARAYFKSMEDGDEKALGLWKKFRDLSIKKYEETYARLNIHFDVYSGESQVKKENIAEALDKIRTADFVERADNGALLIDLTKYKLEKAVVERKDGTPLYLTRDIAEAKQRWDKMTAEKGSGFDKMFYVIATQQDLHTAQFFKVLELMGYDWAQPSKDPRMQHINFGMVTGMSTRKGTAVFLDHILEETKENMHNVMKTNAEKYAQVEDPETTADITGMTAVKIQDMQGKRINNYQFDWARMLSFEGDTGPYLQYNHVRLCSVERRVAETDGLRLPDPLDPATLRLDLLKEDKAKELLIILASWPDIVKYATRELQPSVVVQYCFRLTHAVSSAWEVVIVKGQEKDVALARLFMYRCARLVLGAALRLLTIPPLERM